METTTNEREQVKMEPDKIQDLVEKQRKFFATGKTKDINFRIEALEKLKMAIKLYEDKLYEAVWKDLHKNKAQFYMTELGQIYEELNLHIKKVRKWARPEKVGSGLAQPFASSKILSEPMGNTLIMAPWNYPFFLTIDPLIGAISAGNTAIVKPSEKTPNVAAVMQEILSENFNEEYIFTVRGGRAQNQGLLKEKFDMIFFTGSTFVGKVVMEAAAKHLTPVILELGGKSPTIVHEDANLDMAAKRIVWGKYLNAGQTCVAPDYLMVHKKVKDELLSKMKKYIHKFFGDNPKDSDDMVRIVDSAATERLIGHLKTAEVYHGGDFDPALKYIAPTILNNVKPTDPIMSEEIFGPLLPVIEYENIDDTIDFINKRDKPLAFYLFTENSKLEKKVLGSTSSGGGCVNDTVVHPGVSSLPFGGVGASGMGAYHGKRSFDAFSHKRGILKQSTVFDLPIRYFPLKDKLVPVLRWIFEKLS